MIYVGSLKFSPVYKSHCFAFGKACEHEGYDVRYLFSHEYKWMLTDEEKKDAIFVGDSTGILLVLMDTLNITNLKRIRDILYEDRPTHVYLHNYHLLNHHVARICRKYRGKFIYHVHEPYTENKSAHGGVWQYWLYLNECMERKLLSDTDVAVVSSKEALRLFDARYPHFEGKRVQIPLMYDDLGGTYCSVNERKYVTFVGPPIPSKGPETLLAISDYAARHDLGWPFLVVSRSEIRDHKFHGKSNMTIFYKRHISDEEYGSLIRRSLVVLMPFKRETQSSAILVSYMYGTPVVTSNIGGLPEFVTHGKTGYLVDKNASVEEWIKGIDYTMKNFDRMSKNCRDYFVRVFSGENWKEYLNSILI